MKKDDKEKHTIRLDPSQIRPYLPDEARKGPNKKTIDDGDITSIVSQDRFRDALAQANKAPPALVCLIGSTSVQGKRWEIQKARMSVGRSIENHVLIDDPSVSKQHAMLRKSGRDVLLTDMNSTNDTIVNGRAIPPDTPIQLRHNDQIQIGNVILKFLERGSLESISHQQSYDMRLQDSLTQIYNKGAFLSRVRELFKRAGILDTGMCLVVLDLDHFKKINDRYGHDVGDDVLREMARVIQTQLIRSEDFFARYGGEEFVLIFTDNSLEHAVSVAERIRKTIAQHPFMIDGIPHTITVSAGVASRQPDMQGWEELFKKADQALYDSKANGRNRVTAFPAVSR
jgi:two-component system cell cycle response regulator